MIHKPIKATSKLIKPFENHKETNQINHQPIQQKHQSATNKPNKPIKQPIRQKNNIWARFKIQYNKTSKGRR